MTLSAFLRDERVVLVGIGIATFGLITGMTQILTLIRNDNEVKVPQPKTQYITQETEDSLELETLEKLLAHTNFSIRDVAVKILCDRAVNDPTTVRYLLHGITRPDYDTRMQSLRALATLTGQTNDFAEGLSKLHTWRAYTALVRSLELSLDDVEHTKLDDKYWDEYYLRDMAERFCLMFVLELINKYGADMLVKAKFVEKWLAKQPWGDKEAERQENFIYYMEHKNNRIVEIVNKIAQTTAGAKAIIECKLASKTNVKLTPDPNIAGFMIVLQSTLSNADGDDNQLSVEQVPRTREHSAEEQRLRRQHREAMVFNDGTRPIAREDIIERSHDSSPS
ncbi:cytoskeleton-associated protein [Colletotrichum musicola]|uniref:Cytoskeleton-associated protein n=1 Tax=Colletotrichum musicola TaxID=2175873 RepID=A0A8H6NTS4_9PEZI|nr:cytoskeleton-associated protein [Colletotrichum musicola]